LRRRRRTEQPQSRAGRPCRGVRPFRISRTTCRVTWRRAVQPPRGRSSHRSPPAGAGSAAPTRTPATRSPSQEVRLQLRGVDRKSCIRTVTHPCMKRTVASGAQLPNAVRGRSEIRQ
jgi:hypothetical protein